MNSKREVELRDKIAVLADSNIAQIDRLVSELISNAHNGGAMYILEQLLNVNEKCIEYGDSDTARLNALIARIGRLNKEYKS